MMASSSLKEREKKIKLLPYRTPAERQFDNAGEEARAAYYFFRQSLNSEHPTNSDIQEFKNPSELTNEYFSRSR